MPKTEIIRIKLTAAITCVWPTLFEFDEIICMLGWSGIMKPANDWRYALIYLHSRRYSANIKYMQSEIATSLTKNAWQTTAYL